MIKTQKIFIKSLLCTSFLAASMTIMMPSVSEARCSCTGVRNIVRDARININDHTTEVGNFIADTILRGVAQLSAYSKRETEAQARIAGAQDQNATIRSRQEIRAAAESGRFDPAPNGCVDLSGIVEFGGGQTVQGIGGFDIANLSRNRSYGNGAEGAAVRAGGLALSQEIIADRDALQNIGGVADPTSDVRLLTEAITLDTSDQNVARAYARMVNNMIDPLPPQPITEGEAGEPEGQARIVERQIDATRRSPAHAIMGYLGDLATPTGGEPLAEWAARAAGPAYPNTVGDKVSKLQAIDIFVHSRFPDPEWHQALAKISPETVLREIALTNALNLYVNWERFNLERRVAAATAANLSDQIDSREGSATGASLSN